MALSDAHLSQFMAAQQAAAREQVLVSTGGGRYSFNCGSMSMSASKLVTADARKGTAVLSMEDDGLLRFSWRLRHKEENEQQFFVFPGGATWARVAECTDGAVFLLKFRDSDVRQFFWSQEPKADAKAAAKKEAEILRRVSALLANPPAFGAPLPTEAELAAAAAADEDEAMTDVASVNVLAGGETAAVQGTGQTAANPVTEAHRGVHVHPQPGTVVPPASASAASASPPAASPSPSPAAPAAAAAAPGPAPAAGSGALDASSLLSTLNAMAQQLQARQDEQAAAGGRAGVEDVLDADRVQPLLDVDAALVDALVEFLPEGQRSPAALRAQLRSPQLQQTMSRLSELLNSSQFGQLMASLSLPVGAHTGLGVDAFLAAIQAQANKQNEEKK